MRIPEVARLLNVHPNTVAGWVRRGIWTGGRRVKLAAEKVGGCWSITDAALAAFRAACNTSSTPEPGNPAADRRQGEKDTETAYALLGGR